MDESFRRRSQGRSPACEALEGRTLLSGVANTVNSALVHPPRFGNSARFAHVNVRHHFGHASGATSQSAATSADPSADTTSTTPNAASRAQLETDMAKLRSDTEAIRAKSTVTPGH